MRSRCARLRAWLVGAWPLVVPVLGACGEPPAPGARWEVMAEALPAALISVWGRSATDVWAVGADLGAGPLVLRFDGEGWREVPTGASGDLWWVHGVDGGPVYLAGEGGLILEHDGATFREMATPGTGTVFGLWASGPGDVWAVGGTGADAGFLWRYDGDAWAEVPLPAAAGTSDVFKVWGLSRDSVWFVGRHGLVLHWDGSSLSVEESGTEQTLLTVHALGERVVAVGGAGAGLILERPAVGGAWQDATPDFALPTLGVRLTELGGFAVGMAGLVLERREAGWAEVDTGLPGLETLHSVWVAPTGQLFAVGGHVLAPPLTQGLILRGQATVP